MSNKKNISAFTIIVAFLSIALMGIALVPLLPVKLAPSRTLPSLTVYFSMPNNSARVVESTSTSKLESMLARIKGVKNIYSTSGNGWGNITLEFDKHSSIDVARFEASTIVRQAWPDLPRELSYPYISVQRPDQNASKPFMIFTVNSAASPIVIMKYTENKIKPILSDIAGIYKINVTGATPMEWQLSYDSRQLQAYEISIKDIQEALARHYSTDFLGMVETKNNKGNSSWIRLMLSSDGKHKTLDASAISVKNQKGKLIRLDQLVKVSHQEQAPKSYYRINGLNSIYVSLTAEETANQIRLSKSVHAAMNQIRQSMPVGYEIHKRYDATEYIQKELNKIYLRSGVTVFILLLFVLFITRNVRYLVLITVSLIVNLAIAVICYYLLKLEIQLYSLAGITISLSLIIDNTIIMTDHLMHRGNRNAFMPILAATMTTVGALTIIFFLDEKIRLNLQDFASVIIINLSVSLAVALFFVPAMVEKIRLRKRVSKKSVLTRLFPSLRPKRIPIYFTRLYGSMTHVLSRRKWIPFTLIVLLFGMPIFLLPDKIDSDTSFARYYNKLFDSSTYKKEIKPILNKTLGGTLRLFVENVYQKSYYTREEEKTLIITASMPNGTTLSQMNDLVVKMEHYLSRFPEIRQFQTEIPNPRRATIRVFFTKASEHSGFPYRLKSEVIGKALELGGGSWGVYGLRDNSFSNDVREQAGNYRMKLYGYNYDELTAWADTLKNHLLSYRRIKEVLIRSNFSWFKDDYHEFAFDINKESLARNHFLPDEFFGSLTPILNQDRWVGSLEIDGEREDIKLSSQQGSFYDIWQLRHAPQLYGKQSYKVDKLADISKEQEPQEISKENQQYRLVLQYDYIGATSQGKKVLEEEIKELKQRLPMGYTVEKVDYNWTWDENDKKQYLFLGLLIVIIFFTTSVLFNSFQQPLSVIFVIPISFIGVFLTFYWFQLNFDQGGFASLILLSGITVNASIYILNEYNHTRKVRPLLSPLQAYLKAWNTKIIPIFLTAVSTILGFIPFMIGIHKEAFWFPLAAGTIGGLTMSIIAIWIFLPLCILKKP